MRRDEDLEATIVAKFVVMSPVLDERARRLWAAAESVAIGYGGDALVSAATGLARETIRNGRRELAQGVARAPGGFAGPGPAVPNRSRTNRALTAALERLVDPLTRGDPMSPLRWTCKSRAKLTAALTAHGWRVSSTTVGPSAACPRLPAPSAAEDSRRARRIPIATRSSSTSTRPPRRSCSSGNPVISVDTKKKELVGDFKNAGREWQPTRHAGAGAACTTSRARRRARPFPYGVYDMARNEAWVSVGRDHDTPAFAVASIRQWWTMMGRAAYPGATHLLITADAGGSNGYRTRGVEDRNCNDWPTTCACASTCRHFPPGTSKWNKIEHRLFCHITRELARTRPADLRNDRGPDRPHQHRDWAARARPSWTNAAIGLASRSPRPRCATSRCIVMTFTATGIMKSDHAQVDYSILIRGLRARARTSCSEALIRVR